MYSGLRCFTTALPLRLFGLKRFKPTLNIYREPRQGREAPCISEYPAFYECTIGLWHGILQGPRPLAV